MVSESTRKTDKTTRGNDQNFETGKILALSIGHFIHDVYSSFLAPLLPLLIEKLSMSLTQAGFLSTVMQIPALLNPYIGLNATYLISAAMGLIGIPFVLVLPRR